MAHNEVLEPADLADGYILACQAVPLTPWSALPTEHVVNYRVGKPALR
jgi:hypothetical protein